MFCRSEKLWSECRWAAWKAHIVAGSRWDKKTYRSGGRGDVDDGYSKGRNISGTERFEEGFLLRFLFTICGHRVVKFFWVFYSQQKDAIQTLYWGTTDRFPLIEFLVPNFGQSLACPQEKSVPTEFGYERGPKGTKTPYLRQPAWMTCDARWLIIRWT